MRSERQLRPRKPDPMQHDSETEPDRTAPDRSHQSFSGKSNDWIAERLRQAASLLAAQGANSFRVSAWRNAADAIEQSGPDIRTTMETGGHAALEAIPGVGRSIAGAIMEMLATGRWGYLERLKGAADPDALFSSVPGIGPTLAHQIQETLHLDSLEALEAAAHDGRLRQVRGFGARRAAVVRGALAELLTRIRPHTPRTADEPEVALLLDVDREYREKAASGTLRKIAPKRFNPGGEAWLPVLHTVRGLWHFTVLWSNTARAHELGRTGDWVVVYFHQDTRPEGRRTIVTETHGPARGSRVVRGREAECLALQGFILQEGASPAALPALRHRTEISEGPSSL